jgi:hypothetical protein
VRFFHPSGLSASLKATYFNQAGEFTRRGGIPEPGSDQFWVVDVGIGYRLPKRYGFISFGVANLFNKHFNYQETDLRNPIVQPSRFIYGKITLALP